MLTACTIVASNFLPSARVLAESFFLHHPQGRVTVLLIDDEDRRCSPDDDAVDWRRLSDLGLERNEIHRLAVSTTSPSWRRPSNRCCSGGCSTKAAAR